MTLITIHCAWSRDLGARFDSDNAAALSLVVAKRFEFACEFWHRQRLVVVHSRRLPQGGPGERYPGRIGRTEQQDLEASLRVGSLRIARRSDAPWEGIRALRRDRDLHLAAGAPPSGPRDGNEPVLRTGRALVVAFRDVCRDNFGYQGPAPDRLERVRAEN